MSTRSRLQDLARQLTAVGDLLAHLRRDVHRVGDTVSHGQEDRGRREQAEESWTAQLHDMSEMLAGLPARITAALEPLRLDLARTGDAAAHAAEAQSDRDNAAEARAAEHARRIAAALEQAAQPWRETAPVLLREVAALREAFDRAEQAHSDRAQTDDRRANQLAGRLDQALEQAAQPWHETAPVLIREVAALREAFDRAEQAHSDHAQTADLRANHLAGRLDRALDQAAQPWRETAPVLIREVAALREAVDRVEEALGERTRAADAWTDQLARHLSEALDGTAGSWHETAPVLLREATGLREALDRIEHWLNRWTETAGALATEQSRSVLAAVATLAQQWRSAADHPGTPSEVWPEPRAGTAGTDQPRPAAPPARDAAQVPTAAAGAVAPAAAGATPSSQPGPATSYFFQLGANEPIPDLEAITPAYAETRMTINQAEGEWNAL